MGESNPIPSEDAGRAFLPVRSRRYIQFGAAALLLCGAPLVRAAAAPDVVVLDGQRLAVKVDVRNCRWSAELKGTDVKLNKVYFLGDDNPLGWSVTATVNRNDVNPLGAFETVTLHGVQSGRLDFDYHISVSKTGNDIVVRLDRANNTDAPVEIGDLDYLVVEDARLGGTTDKWLSFGARSVFSEYYDLTLVRDFPAVSRGEYRRPQKMYEVCHLVRNQDSGNVILLGHLTVNKGHSRFEVGRKDAPDSMRLRAYCTYAVTMPPGKSFIGEKLLVHLGGDGLRSLEHLGDLIGVANDIRLKEKRPLDLEDRSLLSFTHTRWIGWMSGGTAAQATQFIKDNGLDKFYYGTGQGDPEIGRQVGWGVAHAGGGGSGRGGTSAYPAECYLPVNVPWGNGKVLDFSNPLCVEAEKQRIAAAFAGQEGKVNLGEVDYSEIWDKWPGQHDPFLSAVETWHAAVAPWRDFIDAKSPRMRNHSCMTKLDFNYGYIDFARVAEDSDGMNVPDTYVGGYDLRGPGHRGFLGECVPGATMRFFYNGRVFWNDGDHSHVYKYAGASREGSRIMPYDEAKVSLTYKALATSCARLSDAFDGPYPAERLELLKRVSPPTADTAYPVDLFVRKPALVWNLPVERAFGRWSILGVFNFGPKSRDLTVTLEAAQDLRLDPQKEYLVYEFWSRKLVGTFRGYFVSRAVGNKDCDVYSIVAKEERPVLVSTSRHVRQMAFDLKDLRWDEGQNLLRGLSRAVSGDPYELRIWVPAGYRLDRVELPAGLTAATKTQGDLLLVDYTTSTDADVAWTIRFLR